MLEKKINQGPVILESIGLRYGGGKEVLSDIQLSLEPGSFHFLTGVSGAGKSSLLSLMYLAQRPTRGQLNIFNEDVFNAKRNTLSAIRSKIGVVFQDFRLLNHLSAFDNVALPLRVNGLKETEIKNHVTELLEWVGLTSHIYAKPETMSGGQQQRIAIARAVINRPFLLLADEPTGNVDDEMAKKILHLLMELNRLGTTVVIATHSESLIKKFDFPIINLDNGRLSVIEQKSFFPIRKVF